MTTEASTSPACLRPLCPTPPLLRAPALSPQQDPLPPMSSQHSSHLFSFITIRNPGWATHAHLGRSIHVKEWDAPQAGHRGEVDDDASAPAWGAAASGERGGHPNSAKTQVEPVRGGRDVARERSSFLPGDHAGQDDAGHLWTRAAEACPSTPPQPSSPALLPSPPPQPSPQPSSPAPAAPPAAWARPPYLEH